MTIWRFPKSCVIPVLLLVAALPASAEAQQGASKEVANGMQRLAGAISEFFEREGHDKVVTVGSVVNPDGDGSELLRRLLTEYLTKEKFQLRKAKYAVNGRFIKQFRKASERDAHNSVAMRVTAEIRDRSSDDQNSMRLRTGDETERFRGGPTHEVPRVWASE